jgi:hypothetical protein
VKVGDREISVTQNLESALRNTRKPEDVVWMWADAICINQDDDKEKEAQVQMMRDIYGTARIVTVFLGSGTDEGSFLIGEINRIGGLAVTAGVQSLKMKNLWIFSMIGSTTPQTK